MTTLSVVTLRNNELKGYGRKRAFLRRSHYPGVSLEGLRKSAEILSQDGLCPCRDSNRVPPEYKAEALLLELTCSVT
jgi:hypothetical protein